MGFFDIFSNQNKSEEMIDNVISTAKQFNEHISTKETLLDFLNSNKLGGRITPSIITWDCIISGEPWHFFVGIENGEIKKDTVLSVSYLIPMGREETSKFGNLSFFVSKHKDGATMIFFTIKPALMGLELPDKGLKLGQLLREKGYEVSIYGANYKRL